jgi:hypothetical protein
MARSIMATTGAREREARVAGGDARWSEALIRAPWLLAAAALKIVARELDAQLVRRLTDGRR